MAKDLHEKPFDEHTLIKLHLYKDYLSEWLPVFVRAKTRRIEIFDFFCGPGKDLNGLEGSPLIALKSIQEWKDDIEKEKIHVTLYLNEYDRDKYEALEKTLEAVSYTDRLKIKHTQKDFKECFSDYYRSMNKDPSSAKLLFLDQNGIKQIDQNVFKALLNLQKTDFLFFISSSYLVRFGETKEFRALQIPQDAFQNKDYYHCHRAVFDFYKDLIPNDVQAYLAQFTIKKGSNIYGLIFCSQHLLGIHKFIECCWKEDPVRGEANFDIDSEKYNPAQASLFDPDPKPKKLEIFERELTEALNKKSLITNKDVYIFALERGFLPARHAKPILQKLKDKNLLKRVPSLGRDIHKIEPVFLEF